MYGQILKSLENPDDYLHQGFGRLQMASIRRIRFRGIFNNFISADLPVYQQTPSTQFVDLLNEDASTIARICELLDQFSKDGSTWRLLWLLYLSKDVEPSRMRDVKLAARLTRILDRIRVSPELPPMIRLWASTPGYPQPTNSTSADQMRAGGERSARCGRRAGLNAKSTGIDRIGLQRNLRHRHKPSH